jgi:hypothetical protein
VKQRDLKATEDFVRVCSRQKQVLDENGELLGVTWEAFSLRPQDQGYVSGACLQSYVGQGGSKIKTAADAILDGFGPTVNKNSYAVLVRCVPHILACCAKRNRKARLRLEPKHSNAGYAALRQLPSDNSDQELLELLSETSCGVTRMYRSL